MFSGTTGVWRLPGGWKTAIASGSGGGDWGGCCLGRWGVGPGVLVVVGPVPRSGGWPPLSGSGAWVPGRLKPRLHSSFPRVGLHPFGWLAV